MKKLIVFISSIIDDAQGSAKKELQAERTCVRELVEEMPFLTPWLFENQPASSQDRNSYYLNAVRESSIFILLLDKTLTEGVKKEYSEAVESGKPILVFMKEGPKDRDLERFIGKISPRYKYKPFSSLDDLKKHVRDAIYAQIGNWADNYGKSQSSTSAQQSDAERYWTERRIEVLAGKNIPVQLFDRPGVILLLMPLVSLRPGQRFELKKISRDQDFCFRYVQPLCWWQLGQDLRVEPTRLIKATSTKRSGESAAYIQIFDTGILESVERGTFISPRRDRKNRDFLFINKFEAALIETLEKYLQILKKLAVEPPAYLFLALTGTDVGVSGVGVDRFYDFSIDWQNVPLREVTIENYDVPACSILKGLIDSVWAAYGWMDGSPNFLKDGRYKNTEVEEVGMHVSAADCFGE